MALTAAVGEMLEVRILNTKLCVLSTDVRALGLPSNIGHAKNDRFLSSKVLTALHHYLVVTDRLHD